MIGCGWLPGMTTSSAAGMTTVAPVYDRALTISSTAALVMAGVVNSLLHESAHAFAALACGLTPTLSSFSVDVAEAATARQETVIALAGPLFSLVMGLTVMRVTRHLGRGVVRLFWMWLAFLGVMNFVGYCFIAPFARGGDTGQALALLGAPGWVYVLVAAFGVAGQFWLARRFAFEVSRYTSATQDQRRLAYFPWLLAMAVAVVQTLVELLALRVPAIYFVPVLAYAFAFAVFAPMQFLFADRIHRDPHPETLRVTPWSRPALVLTGLAVVADVVLALTGGVTLG